MNDVLFYDVRADDADEIQSYATARVRVATRLVGATGTVSNGQLHFSLAAGKTYALVTSVMSNFDDANYPSKAIAAELFIHYRTVESHRNNICQKLSLRGPNALFKFALQHKSEL